MRAARIALLCLIATLPLCAQLDPATLTHQQLAELPWKNTGQREQITIFGDPTKEGLYGVVLRWPPGTGTMPHTHPNDRFVAILKGTWWVGTGTNYDMSKTVPMKAGTFLTHTANRPHFDGAKDEEVILYVVGMGPGTTVYLK